jgi:uncharacterized repeat protein (TIGR01451 family)
VADVDAVLGYRCVVTNIGSVTAQDVVVTNPVPFGARYENSTPAGQEIGSRVEWRLGSLVPGQTAAIDVGLKALQGGQIQNCVWAEPANGDRVDDCLTTRVNVQALEISVLPPVPPDPQVDQTVSFGVRVTNRGNVPLTNVIILDRFPPELEPELAAGLPRPREIIERALGDLAPGQTKTVGVTFVARRAGTHFHTVEARADGGATASQRASVTVVEAPRSDVRVDMSGPGRVRAGEAADVTLTVQNTGETTLRGLTLAYEDQDDLLVTDATQGFTRLGRQLVRTIAELLPGARASFQLRLRANRIADRVCNRATVTSQDGLRRQAELCLEITRGAETPPAIPPDARRSTPPVQPEGLLRMGTERWR